MLKNNEAIIELFEHFIKQTYRNRCSIYGANGKLDLIVPVEKSKGSERKIMKDCRISYSDPWQKLHWRSLESAYRRSPYFEYYEDGLAPFYEKKVEFLVDWNEMLQEKICELLQQDLRWKKTEKYEEENPDSMDLRGSFDPNKMQNAGIEIAAVARALPRNDFESYVQVFGTRYGFIHDLSIVDLLFNTGPEASQYL